MQNAIHEKWYHSHNFHIDSKNKEKKTLYVIIISTITMTIEIFFGLWTGSMALFADGLHMGTHVAALLITLFAYYYAGKHKNDPRFTFGTGKVSTLGGFASAISLGIVSLFMIGESINRILNPENIHFNEAIFVAIVGLTVNLVCALLLKESHHHNNNKKHSPHKNCSHDHHIDHNLKAAFFHVLADALTSIFAIAALLAGKNLGLNILDPIMGIAGAIVIAIWAIGLLKETSRILLDSEIKETMADEIINVIEKEKDNQVSDIHIWRIGPKDIACMLTVVTHDINRNSDHYKKLLKDYNFLTHTTVEVNHCLNESCIN